MRQTALCPNTNRSIPTAQNLQEVALHVKIQIKGRCAVENEWGRVPSTENKRNVNDLNVKTNNWMRPFRFFSFLQHENWKGPVPWFVIGWIVGVWIRLGCAESILTGIRLFKVA